MREISAGAGDGMVNDMAEDERVSPEPEPHTALSPGPDPGQPLALAPTSFSPRSASLAPTPVLLLAQP
eukprot:scaffold81077_cov75-Phaeocystis_antarctica.AAC.4